MHRPHRRAARHNPSLSPEDKLRVYEQYASSIDAVIVGGRQANGSMARDAVDELGFRQHVLNICLAEGRRDYNAAWHDLSQSYNDLSQSRR